MSKLSESFEAAAAYLSSSSSLANVSNDVKLELYALFKCITFSNKPATLRPSLFDFTGRAKWDAWDKLGKQKKELPELEERYLEIAQSLGWQDSEAPEVTSPEGEPETTTTSSGGGGGMGIAVSIIPQPPPDPKDEGTLHSFALSNDAEGLASFLGAHPRIEVNLPDGYGYTPLHLAADRGNADAVKVLLRNGADASIQDPDEFTALDLAEVGGHDEIVEIIRGSAAH